MVRAHLGPQKKPSYMKIGDGFFVFLMLITVSNHAFRNTIKSGFYLKYRDFSFILNYRIEPLRQLLFIVKITPEKVIDLTPRKDGIFK